MVNGKQRRNKKKTVRKAKPIRRRRGARTGSSLKPKSSFGGMIVQGIRSLISVLPGSTALKPIADLVFTSMGFSTAIATDDATGQVKADVSFYGLSGLFCINYVNILARSANASRNTNKDHVWIDTPYTDAKLLSVTISIQPDNVIQSRSGKWGLLFIPIRAPNDLKNFVTYYKGLTFLELSSMPGARVANGDQPLSLSYRPTPEDGIAYQFQTIDSIFGICIVVYSDDLRSSYTEFSASDFSPNVTVRGSIKCRQPLLSSGTLGYEDKFYNYDAYPAVCLQISENSTHLPGTRIALEHRGYKCAKTEDKSHCKIEGLKYVPKSLLDLRCMEI